MIVVSRSDAQDMEAKYSCRVSEKHGKRIYTLIVITTGKRTACGVRTFQTAPEIRPRADLTIIPLRLTD